MADPRDRSVTTAAQPPANRREEDGEKPGFEQQDVPLKTQKGLAGDRQRQIQDEEQDDRDDWQEARHEQNRNDHTGAAKKVQESVARVEPAERRQKERSGTA